MKYKILSFVRYSLQIISLTLFVLLFTYLLYPLNWQATLLQWFSHLDPWGLISHLHTQRSMPDWGWLPLLVIVITQLFGRVFCGWFCPFGALLTFADKISRVFFKIKLLRKIAKFRAKIPAALLPYRYFWLLFLVVLSILGSGLIYSITPFALLSREVVKIYQGEVPWVLITITLITLIFSRIWCSVLCPTGILLSLFGKLRLFRYQVSDNCIHCKKCIQSCSVGAAPADTGTSKEGCLVCGKCQSICPTKTVKYLPPEFRKKKASDPAVEAAVAKAPDLPSRRRFFKIAGTAAIVAAAAFMTKTVSAARKVLRPPGALTESEFLSVCNRCGRCIKVCPNNALQPMPLLDGIEYFETPHIIPRQASCSICLSCQEVCPTGAIAKIALEEINMGKALIDKKRCLAWNENKLCFICGEQCPVVAITGDEKHRPTVQIDKCIGCGSCERACPVDGEAAIRVEAK